MAIRDRDIAAEIMGVHEFAYKLIAFAISSFFAGIAGALFASFVGRVIPEYWNLFLSVQFIAIILIGGAGTVAGALLGSAFVVLLPRIVENFTAVAAIARPRRRRARRRYCQCVHRQHRQTDFGLINTMAGVGPGLSRRPAEPRPIRSSDHRVSHLRAARLVRDLAQDPQLLEGLAVHLLSGHERAPALTSNTGGRNNEKKAPVAGSLWFSV